MNLAKLGEQSQNIHHYNKNVPWPLSTFCGQKIVVMPRTPTSMTLCLDTLLIAIEAKHILTIYVYLCMQIGSKFYKYIW